MPQIDFIVDRASGFGTNVHGLLNVAPALPAQGRLYVIWNGNHARPAYVGTTGDVQARFRHRLAALNETGLLQADLQNQLIYTVRVTINGIARQPDDQGVAGGIDVEHLLIRIYLQHYQFGLRNTAKWNNVFVNADVGGLWVRHLDPQGLVPGFAALGNGGFHQLLAGAGNY